MSTEHEAAASEVRSDAAARERRGELARKRSRAAELQAVVAMWLGVLLAIAGVVVLIALSDKLIAGLMTFGGALIVLLGLVRGAYGHYIYWRTATG